MFIENMYLEQRVNYSPEEKLALELYALSGIAETLAQSIKDKTYIRYDTNSGTLLLRLVKDKIKVIHEKVANESGVSTSKVKEFLASENPNLIFGDD